MNIHRPVSRQFTACVMLFLLSSKAVFPAVTDTTVLTPPDTLVPVTNFNVKKALKQDFTYTGLGFIASGFIVKSRKEDFRAVRHYFQPTFKTTWDNYAQYSPLLTTWALSAAGVQGRSSLPRLAVSNALSFAVMAGMVNIIKHTTRELRPDGRSRNSFPSGHTATSFVAATILHKEYGLTRSPWYSIAGYSVATATGICRILNNRHWVSDVLVGAGIGILSTDIGYALGDLIFKNKGLNRRNLEELNPNISNRPSFFAINIDVAPMLERFKAPDIYDNYDENMRPYTPGSTLVSSHPLGLKLNLGASMGVAVESAYFLNDYVGVGGRLCATTTPVTATIDLSHGFKYDMYAHDLQADLKERFVSFVGLESNHVGMFSFSAGAYFSYPLASRLRLGGKVLIGRRLTTDCDIDAITNVDVEGLRNALIPISANDKQYFKNPEEKKELTRWLDDLGDGRDIHDGKFLTIKSNKTPMYSTGLYLTWAYKHGMSFKADINYDYAEPEYTYELRNRVKESRVGTRTYLTDTFKRRTHMHQPSFSFGMAFNF